MHIDCQSEGHRFSFVCYLSCSNFNTHTETHTRFATTQPQQHIAVLPKSLMHFAN